MSAIAGLDCKTDVEAFSVGKSGKVEKNNILRSTGVFTTNRNQALVFWMLSLTAEYPATSKLYRYNSDYVATQLRSLLGHISLFFSHADLLSYIAL